ncbi:YdeI/OmpD-associated family protein [uncultured Roseivirga sp.]|uniref:YdeI/OmpD-associated family protein n=1 Tax=uncultured Roseivirga sp. TaxID=543088 RepID=UPI0030DBC635
MKLHVTKQTDYFDGLSKSAKKILLLWVISAKRPETRQKRVLEIAENASENLKPKQFR